MEPFSATLEADPTRLRDLRMRIATWLGNAGIDGDARDAVVLATHEAAAGAIQRSPTRVSVDAMVEGRSIAIVVTSDAEWVSPDIDDEESHWMHVVRAVMSKVRFEQGPGQASLHLERRF
jgi:hypothetical protein